MSDKRQKNATPKNIGLQHIVYFTLVLMGWGMGGVQNYRNFSIFNFLDKLLPFF